MSWGAKISDFGPMCRDPTRTFFLLPEPDPNYFSKFPSLGFFPAGRSKSFNNNPQILLFCSRPDMKSSVSIVKCLRYKKWKSQENLRIDLWCILIYSSWDSQINQCKRWQFTLCLFKPTLLINLKLHFTTARSSTFSGFNMTLLGLTTLPAIEKTRSDLDEATGTGKTT